ncbi:PRDM8 protein, partial [Poecile atricapillus]|nr:PRDM8 protein [Poecile atricapillus]
MEDAGVQRGIWDGDAKTVQQCLTDIFTSVYTTCDIPENAIFGPCVLSHTSLYDSIAFIALKSTDKRTVPYIFRVDTSAANGSSEGLMWLRLVQSAREREEQNLEAYIKSGQLFYRSLRRIAKDEELLVWYGKELTELLLLGPARAPARTNGGCPARPPPSRAGGRRGIPTAAGNRVPLLPIPKLSADVPSAGPADGALSLSLCLPLSPSLSPPLSPSLCRARPPQARRPSPALSAASASSSNCPSPHTSGSAAPRGFTAPTPAPPPRPPASRTAPARSRSPASSGSPAGRRTTPSPGPTAAPPPAPSPPRTSTTWRGSWRTPAVGAPGPRGGRRPPRAALRRRPGRRRGASPRRKSAAPARRGAASRRSGRGCRRRPRRSRAAPRSSILYTTAFWPKSSAAAAVAAAAAGPLQLQLPSALTLLPPSFTSLCLPAQNWCAKCNASFRMTSDLVYHMRSHHKKEYALEPLVKRRREEKLKCPICNESFRERHHLSRHMTSHN